MQPQTNDDRFLLDAPLAVHLLGWGWWYDPKWDWMGLWPPDTTEWLRFNFPEEAQRQNEPGQHKLSPSWNVGGCPASDKTAVGLPRFASDWRNMPVVINGMAQRGFWWRGTHYSTPDDPARATFSSRTADFTSQAETLPRATAMAAVAALEGAKMAAVFGEISAETVRGKLTAIQSVAAGGDDEFYMRWLDSYGVGNTRTAALAFIEETAALALAQLEAA